MNKKSITILVVCLIVTVLSVSLAYYSARIIGNGKNVSVNAKELTINFDNNNEIASGIIEPGWSSTNTFSVENKSKTTFTYDIVLKNYKNTTKTNGYLVYKITSTNGYNMTEYKDMPKDGENTYDLVIARGITIEPGSNNKQSYTLEIKYLDSTEDQSIDMGSTVTGSLYIVESTTNENNPYTKGTLGYQIMEDNSNIKTRTDFSTTYTDVNIGTMYKAKEDNTDVYYFAGDARNNWVKFGIFPKDIIVYRGYNTDYAYLPFKEYDTLEECQNGTDNYNNNCIMHKYANAGDAMYWRIVRTNKDGSIRLLYAGTSSDSNEGMIGVSEFYPRSSSDPIYAGYMYGTSGSLENNRLNTNNSSIKKFIDNWYTKSLVNFNKYLSTTAIYCNDRTLAEGETYSVSSPTNFAGSVRILNNAPTYNCSNRKDAFSVDNTEAKLTYPIALMTADEVVYAGGNYHLYSNSVIPWYSSNSLGKDIVKTYFGSGADPSPRLLTPYSSSSIEKTVNIFTLENATQKHGRLRAGSGYVPDAVRPVVSLKLDVLYKSGDGSASNPYEVNAEPVNMYTVSLTVNNGSGTSTVLVEEGKNATFTVTPNSGYKAELETNTCGGTLSGNTYIISNITSTRTCSITFKKNLPTLSSLIQANAVNENGYRYEGSNPNNYIKMEKTDGTKEIWRIIGLFPDGVNGENVIRVRRHYEKNNYPTMAFNSKNENYWASTSMYSTLKDIYSLSNYKNTVNYVMHLGAASSSSFSLTASGIYTTERGNTAGATSSTSYESAVQTIGSVGLMYASDFTYAAVESDCTRTTTLINYDEITACHNNNWLYQGSSQTQWTLTTYSNSSYFIVIVRDDGRVDTRKSSVDGGWPTVTISTIAYSPVMALKSDVVVTGSGTQNDPYVIN